MAGFAVVGMGIQNALMRLLYGGSVQTTVMTGNVTQLVFGAVTLLSPAERATSRAQVGRVGALVFGFIAGAAAGAALTRFVGVTSMLLPAAIAFGLGIRDRATPRRDIAR